jgi:hypothetical protein
MDSATLTAYGTMLTALAALLAVWFGYRSTRRQIKSAATNSWIQSFRAECANFLVVAERLHPYAEKPAVMDYYKHATALRLFLSSKNPHHFKLIKGISDFTEFAVVEYNPNTNEVRAEYYEKYPKYHNELISQIENIIENAESTL